MRASAPRSAFEPRTRAVRRARLEMRLPDAVSSATAPAASALSDAIGPVRRLLEAWLTPPDRCSL